MTFHKSMIFLEDLNFPTVETRAAHLAIIKQKSECISNPNWRNGHLQHHNFLEYKNTKGLGKKNKYFREMKSTYFEHDSIIDLMVDFSIRLSQVLLH